MNLYYSDLRELVEFAEDHGEINLTKRFREILALLEKENPADHRDLWEMLGDRNVHPARVAMTNAAKQYKAAQRELEEAQRTAVRAKPRYAQRVVKADPDQVNYWWKEIPEDLRRYAAYIIENLTNRAELDADMHYWGSGVAADDQHRSVLYYITPIPGTNTAVVSHDGGGWVLLKKDLFVGVADWVAVINGERPLPEAWLNKA